MAELTPSNSELPQLYGGEAIDRLRRIARPVLFWTDAEEAPVSVGGTLFIAGLGPSLFLITAKHVIRDWPVEKLLLLPCDGARKAFSVSRFWNVEDPTGDPDTADLFLMRAELAGLPKDVRRTARVLDLNKPGVWDWTPRRFTSTYFTFGFPKVLTSVDYEAGTVDTSQVFLKGAYEGPSFTDGLHKLQVENPHGLESFDGCSGSPVLCTTNEIGRPSQTYFCGVAIRGSAAEGRVHFIGSDLLMDALDQANETAGKP